MEKINTLHLFNHYLPPTQKWVYELISSIPKSQAFIGANHFLNHDFYNPDFQFIKNHFDSLIAYKNQLNKKNRDQFLQKAIIQFAISTLPSYKKVLLKFFQTNEVDIVHTHFAPVAWAYLSLVKKLKKPFIISFYGFDYEQLPYTQPVFKIRYQKLFKEADLFLCEGFNGKRILIKQGCPPEKIEVLKLGIKPTEIPVFSRKKRKGELNLIQVADFQEKKGQEYTIRAFARTYQGCKNMTLTLVGKERQKGQQLKLQHLINSLGLKNVIKIRSRIPLKELHYYLSDYHVFIHPSCYASNMDCEGGAPIVLLDAQATGMPIISTNHCDIPEEVIHNQTGILVNEKDVDALAKAIEDFYFLDQAFYLHYAKRARSHITSQYDVNHSGQRLREIYAQLLL